VRVAYPPPWSAGGSHARLAALMLAQSTRDNKKASEARDAKRLKLLLALVDGVPYKLEACKDVLEGWFAAWQMKLDLAKQADTFNDNSCLAQGQQYSELQAIIKKQVGAKGAVTIKHVQVEFERRFKSKLLVADAAADPGDDECFEDGDEPPSKNKPSGGGSPTYKAQLNRIQRTMMMYERVRSCEGGGAALVSMFRSKETSATGGRTWCAKQSSLLYLCNFRKHDKALMGQVSRNLLYEFDGGESPTALLDGKAVSDRIDLEYFRFGLLARLGLDFGSTVADPAAKQLLTGPHLHGRAEFAAAHGGNNDNSATFEMPGHVVSVFRLMRGILLGAYDESLQLALHDGGKQAKFDSVLGLPPVKALLDPVVNEWVAATLPRAPKTGGAGSATAKSIIDGVEPSGANGDCDAGATQQSETGGADCAKELFYNNAVDEEMSALFHGLVAKSAATGDMIEALSGSNACWGQLREGRNRLWLVEECFHIEDGDKVKQRGGNPFQLKKSGAIHKLPKEQLNMVFEVAAHKRREEGTKVESAGPPICVPKNVFVVAPNGNQSTTRLMHDLCKGFDASDPALFTLAHKQSDVDARKNYKSPLGPPVKKIRLASAEDLCTDKILVSCDGDREFDAIEPKHIGAGDWTSFDMPILGPCPLLRPADILHVRPSVKKAIMSAPGARSIVGGATHIGEGAADADDAAAGNDCPLYHLDRLWRCYDSLVTAIPKFSHLKGLGGRRGWAGVRRAGEAGVPKFAQGAGARARQPEQIQS
jgi:hypothetical protein